MTRWEDRAAFKLGIGLAIAAVLIALNFLFPEWFGGRWL